MFLYNLFILFIIQERSYFLYVINIVIVFLTQVSFQGYAYRFIWPESTWMANHALILGTAMAGMASMLFVRKFLCLRDFYPKLNKGINLLVIAYILVTVVCLIGFKSMGYQFMQIGAFLGAFLGAFYILFVIIAIYRKGNRAAKILLFAWSTFLTGICIFVLKDMGILPHNDFTNYTMLVGSAIELLLLSFALADRINQSKKLAEDLLQEQNEKQKLHREKEQIQQDNLRSELSFLKNQVNQHFIFNTFNAFYERALDSDEILADFHC